MPKQLENLSDERVVEAWVARGLSFLVHSLSETAGEIRENRCVGHLALIHLAAAIITLRKVRFIYG